MKNILTINQSEFYEKYDVIFCDVWGVLHDGVISFSKAINALDTWKNYGKHVIFVTNSPRSSEQVIRQLKDLKISKNSFDAIVTSGDVTKYLIENAPEKIYYIGGHNFEDISTGNKHYRVDENEADVIICTSLFPNHMKEIDWYEPLFAKFIQRNILFICANPDIFVDVGHERQWCAGALAKLYETMGGEVKIAGKPNSPIYQRAFELSNEILKMQKKSLEKKKILAIGDGLLTDIKGAKNFDIDCVFIAAGVHKFEYCRENNLKQQNLEKEKLQKVFDHYKIYPDYYMDHLC